jgi:hypothetical protein
MRGTIFVRRTEPFAATPSDPPGVDVYQYEPICGWFSFAGCMADDTAESIYGAAPIVSVPPSPALDSEGIYSPILDDPSVRLEWKANYTDAEWRGCSYNVYPEYKTARETAERLRSMGYSVRATTDTLSRIL